MLIMSRQAGERILIGEDIEIVITHIGRTRVKVGISAPRHVPVVAHEVRLVREQNVAAAAAPGAEQLQSLVKKLRLPDSNSAARATRKLQLELEIGTYQPDPEPGMPGAQKKGPHVVLHSNQR